MSAHSYCDRDNPRIQILVARALRLFKISQIRKDALFKLLAIRDFTAKGLKAERQTSHNISSRDEINIFPNYAADLFFVGQRVSVDTVLSPQLSWTCQQKIFELYKFIENVRQGHDCRIQFNAIVMKRIAFLCG